MDVHTIHYPHIRFIGQQDQLDLRGSWPISHNQQMNDWWTIIIADNQHSKNAFQKYRKKQIELSRYNMNNLAHGDKSMYAFFLHTQPFFA